MLGMFFNCALAYYFKRILNGLNGAYLLMICHDIYSLS